MIHDFGIVKDHFPIKVERRIEISLFLKRLEYWKSLFIFQNQIKAIAVNIVFQNKAFFFPKLDCSNMDFPTLDYGRELTFFVFSMKL